MLTSVTAVLDGSGLLSIQGAGGNGTIDVRQSAGAISVRGLSINTAAGPVAQVSAAAVTRVNINAAGGNDTIHLDLGSQLLAEPVTILAGGGKDTLYSGGADAGQAITLTNIVKAERSPDGTVFWLTSDSWLNVTPAAYRSTRAAAPGRRSTPATSSSSPSARPTAGSGRWGATAGWRSMANRAGRIPPISRSPATARFTSWTPPAR
jgi:hypothetical protein